VPTNDGALRSAKSPRRREIKREKAAMPVKARAPIFA